MKKIITKISLLPLLTLFTKKKTVRSHSDISVATKLKWEGAGKENKGKIKSHKVKRSDSWTPLKLTKLNDDQLLCFCKNLHSQLAGSPHYTVPEASLVELDVLTADMQFALLECQQNKTRSTHEYLNNARQAVVKYLTFLKIKYKVSIPKV